VLALPDAPPQKVPPTQVLAVLLHKWKLLAASHAHPHAPAVQVRTAFAGMVPPAVLQFVQAVPHAVTSSFVLHVGGFANVVPPH